MDRSFLSRPEVIAAARAFVCVRLATYEDRTEAELLRSLAPTCSGELENTVFAVLAPDGRTPLARASRSARGTFGAAGRMAEELNRIARAYPARGRDGTPGLPTVANVRLAVNVAAGDGQPLVLAYARDEAARKALEGRLAPLAWGEQFRGRFVYA